MLLQFTVGNFKSFMGKATLSLEATSDDWLEDDNIAHVRIPDLRLVKAAGIYGPNAGGKSNFIDAMARFRGLVLSSSKDSQQGEPLPVAPFRLHTKTESAPTFFEAVFLKDETRYRYGFEATKEAILSEWLFKQKDSIRETCLFTREKNEISVKEGFREGKGLEQRTRSNALFLSVVTQFNGMVAGEVVTHITNCRVITGLEDAGYMGFTASLLDDKTYGSLIQQLVKSADFGIERVFRQDSDKDNFLASLPKSLPHKVREHIAQESEGGSRILAVHQRFNAKDKPAGFVEFDFASEESDGTRQFLALAGPFLHTLREGSVFVVDEFNAQLHPFLTKRLIGLFNTSANRNNAQLVFATHDQGLLNPKRIRRDQIWFAEKNPIGASELFSLSQIPGIRKDANLEKEYLLGQFGGVPNVGDFQRVVLNGKE
jgi:AAA15 family ATPase/GTPase